MYGHDRLTEAAIDAFAHERFNEGAEAIGDLANFWKLGGNSRADFVARCQYIEEQAVRRSGNHLLRIPIKEALQAKLVRMGQRKIITMQ